MCTIADFHRVIDQVNNNLRIEATDTNSLCRFRRDRHTQDIQHRVRTGEVLAKRACTMYRVGQKKFLPTYFSFNKKKNVKM